MQTSGYTNPITTLEGHSNTIFAVVFNPAGEQVASGSSDNTIKVWDLKTKQCIESFRGHGLKGSFNDQGVLSLAYSQSGTQLASGASDNTVKIWSLDSTTSSKIWKKILGPCQATLGKVSYIKDSYIKSVVYCPDGSTLAAHEGDKISFFDAHTFKIRSTILCTGAIGTYGALVYAPSGNQIASGGRKCIHIFDPRARKLSATLLESDHVMGVSYLGTETTLASGSDDGNLAVWDLRTGSKISQLTGHSKAITSISYSSQRDLFVSASKEQKIKLWDTCLKCQAIIDAGSEIYCVAFSPSGDHVVSGGADTKVKIWDVSAIACSTPHSFTTYAGTSTAAAAAAVAVPSSSASTSAKPSVQETRVSHSKPPSLEITSLYHAGKRSEALALCKQLAESGDAEAQFMLGLIYERGTDVEVNVEEAEKWYYRAALQNHPEADFQRGGLLILLSLTEEKVTDADRYFLAIKCFSRAAQVGSEDTRLKALEMKLKLIDLLRDIDYDSSSNIDHLRELINGLELV